MKRQTPTLLRLDGHGQQLDEMPTLAPAPASDVAAIEELAVHEEWAGLEA